MQQLMADLPTDRTDTSPSFTSMGFDVFGPWLTRTKKLRGGSANPERWALMFICLNSQPFNIKVIESMESDSFICSLRRFFAIRGLPEILRDDQVGHFIGA